MHSIRQNLLNDVKALRISTQSLVSPLHFNPPSQSCPAFVGRSLNRVFVSSYPDQMNLMTCSNSRSALPLSNRLVTLQKRPPSDMVVALHIEAF